MKKLTKSMLNQNLHIVEGNDKLVGTYDIQFLIFNITSKVTCPYKTDVCAYVCYAALEELFRNQARESRADNLSESVTDTFVDDMIQAINWQLIRPLTKGKKIYFRIHSAGDFYNINYMKKWAAIAKHFEGNDRLLFQAYTKSLPMLEELNLNDTNITFVYSIMPDTNPEAILRAKALGLKTFSAVNIGEIPEGVFKCPGQCGPCTACYIKDNGISEIYTEFHGARAKSVKGRVRG